MIEPDGQTILYFAFCRLLKRCLEAPKQTLKNEKFFPIEKFLIQTIKITC